MFTFICVFYPETCSFLVLFTFIPIFASFIPPFLQGLFLSVDTYVMITHLYQAKMHQQTVVDNRNLLTGSPSKQFLIYRITRFQRCFSCWFWIASAQSWHLHQKWQQLFQVQIIRVSLKETRRKTEINILVTHISIYLRMTSASLKTPLTLGCCCHHSLVHPLRLGWGSRPPYMKVSCKNIE